MALRSRSERALLGAAAGIALVWVGLLFSFSQSSFVALVAGVVLAACSQSGRRAIALIVIGAVVFLIAGGRGAERPPRAPPPYERRREPRDERPLEARHERRQDRCPPPRCRRRRRRVQARVREQAHLRSKESSAGASHDTPITVAAETGIVGLALFAWLVVSGLALAFRRRNGDFAGMTALACGIVLAAIGVHSLFYNAFFEDPTVWGVLGLAAVASRVPLAGRSDERPQPSQLDRQVELEREQDQRVDGRQRDGAGERDVERLPEHG